MGGASCLVDVPRVAIATQARVSEVVDVKMVIPPGIGGAGLIARQVWNLVFILLKGFRKVIETFSLNYICELKRTF